MLPRGDAAVVDPFGYGDHMPEHQPVQARRDGENGLHDFIGLDVPCMPDYDGCQITRARANITSMHLDTKGIAAILG
jgi:hypothetical protein